MSQRLLVAVAAFLALLVLGLGFFWQPGQPASQPRGGGDFILQSAAGPVSLAQYRGRVVLINFGYTYCPDVCPTALATIARGLSQLKPEEAARVGVLFVSVDPERDTLERLQEYGAFFHPAIVGVTGTPEQVAAVARQYGVFYAKQKTAGAGGYVVDHSADTYVVAPDGRLAGRLGHGAGPEQVTEEIRKYLNEK